MRASSFGSCIRAQVAERLGLVALEPPPVLAAAFERGNTHEEECAAALRDEGWSIYSEQLEVECEGITGHIDGAIYWDRPDKPMVWEAKAPSAWAAYERAHKTGKHTPLTLRYAWQSSLYMHALGLEQMVSCLDDGRVKSFVIEVPPFSLEQIRNRKALIEAGTNAAMMDCEPECFDDWSCPYRYLHQKAEVVENAIVDQFVMRYDDFGQKIKALKKLQDDAKAELEKLMVFDDRIETETSIVTKYEQSSGVKYDMDLIKDALEQSGRYLVDYELPEKKSPRMKITRKGLDTVPGEE
jgi:hypothetical protein